MRRDDALERSGAARAGAAAVLGRMRPAFAAAAALAAIRRAFELEVEERRLFLWLPVAAGAGVALYFSAAREPDRALPPVLACLAVALACVARERRGARMLGICLCAIASGFVSAQWRAARAEAPAIARIRIAEVAGVVEEMDLRRQGARFLLRVSGIEGLSAGQTPRRLRLTMRQTPDFEAGSFVSLKARLLPPSRAALPGGYDFARDAWFSGIGAVGSVLGRVESIAAPETPDWAMAMMAPVDRARNALAARVDGVVGGDAGAIAAAMVTGKRDRLSEGTRELIREAGIFHIITISGVQMTLVAAIFFWIFRRTLALSRTLALCHPIKKWAAAAAIAGAILYDIGTGSRVGTERALFMTAIVFLAVLFDRQALTMRNLAFAALAVIALEPEAILGASFQLSFAAVAALVAVYEARMRAYDRERAPQQLQNQRNQGRPQAKPGSRREKIEAAAAWLSASTRHGIGGALFATFCATSATVSFMAYHFHEISPYVLIGNPLTLGIIEFFAVPGALLGAALHPLGLDAPVWHYVGLGIDFILWVARRIAAAPGASLHVNAFAPWAIGFLALAVLSAVIWRSWILRATAIPLFAIGLAGAAMGEAFDLAIPPAGDALAFRGPDRRLGVMAKKLNPFAAEQWLRAAGDGRAARDAVAGRCDPSGCIGVLAGGQTVALVLAAEAFLEDCARATIVVTPLFAPASCAAAHVFDRRSLARTGAVALHFSKAGEISVQSARATGQDRPWDRAPAVRDPLARRKTQGGQPAGFEPDPDPGPSIAFN